MITRTAVMRKMRRRDLQVEGKSSIMMTILHALDIADLRYPGLFFHNI